MSVLFALLAAQILVPAAMAQDVFPEGTCPTVLADRNLGCTAEDVNLASIDYTPGSLPPNCVAGEDITLDIALGFVINANAIRYDIATWIARTPGDIKLLPANGGATECALLTASQQYTSIPPPPGLDPSLDPVGGVLVVDDLDGDACYDVTQGSQNQYFEADFPQGLTVPCLPDANGSLTFQTMVSWDQGSAAMDCDGGVDDFAGKISNSKCKAGDPIVLDEVSVLSRLVIEKQTLPDGLTDSFNFTGTIAGAAIAPFSLTDDGEQELTGALDAVYVITESIPSGFELDSIVCTNQTTGDPANVSTNIITGEVTVVMSGAQFDVRCVYTNDQLPGQLTVIKNANGGNDLFNFAYGESGETPTPFTLTTANGTAQRTFQITTGLGGTFQIEEGLTNSQVNDGWRIESAQCVYDDAPGTPIGNVDDTQANFIGVNDVTINAGDAVTCTFVNNAPAQFTITKMAQGVDADTTEFTFTHDYPVLTEVMLTPTGGMAVSSPVVVPVTDSGAGQMIGIFETIPAGWNLDNIACSGTTPSVTNNVVEFTLQPGDDVNCTFTNIQAGRIAVIKNTLGAPDAAFSFTTDLPGATSPFNIQTVGNTGSASIATPPPGDYFITETVPIGWDLTIINCAGLVNSSVTYTGAIGGSDAFEPGDTTANISLAPGEDISCTFTNTQRGQIRLAKLTDPVGTEVFGFTSTSGTTTPIPATFDVTAGTPVVFDNSGAGLLPGTYTVIENDPTPGFDLANISCEDTVNPGPNDSTGDVPSRTATINLDPGELVECTFTNTERANLTIQKAITVDFNDTETVDSEFEFTSSSLPNASFLLTPTLAASPDTLDFPNLVPGTYDVAENVVAALANGWALVGTTCDDGSTVDSIDLNPGEDVTCTFTNAPLGSSTIIKNTVGGDGVFDYTGTVPFLGLALDTSIIGGTANQDYINQLDPLDNPYVIIESDPAQGGFALTGLTCEEMGGTDASGNPVPDNTTTTFAARRADIYADYNEMVTCTFTNTLDGTITIRKQTAPADVDFLFDFVSAEADLTGQIRDYDIASEELLLAAQPGTYSTTETVPAGWQITGISCSGGIASTVSYTGATTSPTDDFEPGDDTVNVTLAAGENVVCEFTNTQESSITIVKQTVGGSGLFNFGSAALGNFAIDTALSNTATFPNRLPGTYLVAENPVPPLWDLTNIVCLGATNSTILIGSDDVFTPGDTGISIDLAPGEDINCTFENTQLVPDISIIKEASPTSYGAVNDVITYTFAVTNSGTATLTNVTVTDPLPNLSIIDCGGGTNVIGSLIPGQSGSCSASYTITQADLDAASLSNTATATGTAPDNSSITATSMATVSSNQVPNIQITKVPIPTSFAAAGVDIAYTLTVSNPGNVTLSNVTVTDPLPGLGPIDCGGGSNVIGDLAPGAPPVVCTAVYTTTQGDVDTGSISNTATATGATPEQSPVSATASATINSTALASIAIVKTPSPITFNAAGVTITYTLAVANNGGVTLSNVTVTDPLQGLSAVNCGGGSNIIASMAPQQVVNCTATLVTTQDQVDAGDINNTATATGTAPDQSSVSVIGNATVRSTAMPSVAIAKASSPTTFAAAGEVITYTLTVTNSGDVTLSNVTVTDPLSGLSAVDCGGGSNIIASMAPQQAVNCTASLTTTQDQVDAGDIDNTATVTGSSPGAQDDVSASSSATVRSTAAPSVSVAKSASPTSFSQVGETITYTLAVTNDGGVTLTNVLVEDPLAGLSPIDCGAEANPVVDLAPGETVNCTASLTTTQDQVDAGDIDNTATVTGSSPGEQDDISASDSASVLNEASEGYVITKTVTDVAGQGPSGEVNAAGDTISYAITVENTGQVTLNNVVVTDPLVTLSCVPASPAVLDPGVTMTCSGTYVVLQSDIDDEGNPTPGSGLIENTATVSSDELPDQSDSVSVSVVPPEVVIDVLAGVCINDVPYISWDLTVTGVPGATDVTVRVYGDGGNGSTDPADYTQLLIDQAGQPLSGQALWPGAAVDQNGNGTAWPGWEQLPDGTWVEVDDGLVPTLLTEFEVNPTASQIVSYPPQTENCVPPQFLPPVEEIPVNNPWALILLMLSVLGIGWYYRPMMS